MASSQALLDLSFQRIFIDDSRQQQTARIYFHQDREFTAGKKKVKRKFTERLWVHRKRDSDEREEKENTTLRAAAFNTKAHHIFCKLLLLLLLLLLPQLHDRSPSVYYKSRILSIGKRHNQFPICCCCYYPPPTPEKKSLFHYSLSLKDVRFGVSISSLSFFPAIFFVDDSPAEKNLHQPHQPL